MKLAIAYSTKDQTELTEQTVKPLLRPEIDLIWVDGSDTEKGRNFHRFYNFHWLHHDIRGGADAAIAYKLTELLKTKYDYLGLMENDVLLDEDWFEPTMALFEKGKADGLEVGAVSSRSYVDRVLIQRDGYAVMHNTGAGQIIFTRQAAEIILRTFRTHWWPANRFLFAQVANIDLGAYAAFKGSQQFLTTDWGWDAQLASVGLASLALTPAKCQMIGQKWPLEQQGLKLTGPDTLFKNYDSFENYRDNLCRIRNGTLKTDLMGVIHRQESGQTIFPHQLGMLPGSSCQGNWKLQWNQGFGPFAFRAGTGGASLSLHISGSCSFLVAGGKLTIEDTRSGFKASPDLTAATEAVSIAVPGGVIPREIRAHFEEGAVFYGLSTADLQPLDTTFRFDWSQLPGVD